MRKNVNPALLNVRHCINNFIRNKGLLQERAEGFRVVDGGALIPTEFLVPQEGKNDGTDLTEYVNEVAVHTGAGAYPILSKTTAKMHTVEELEQNPELAKPTIKDVDFKIKTYRGHLAISREALDDATYDLVSIVEKDAYEQELNTKNDAIAAVLKSATPVQAKGLDGLKKALNTAVPKTYNCKLVMSASLYNELDTLKDKQGRYLIQPDITQKSGETLMNHEVIVVDDNLLGGNGKLVAFYGDLFAYVALFNRMQTSVKWVNNEIFGERLALFSRFDVQKADEKAGVFITYTADTASSAS